MYNSIRSSLRILTLILILPVILFSGCSTSGTPVSKGGKTPLWVTDKNAVYPPEKYLAEVGEGDSLKEAKSDAAGNIAAIFRTRIQVDNTIQTRYSEITGDNNAVLSISGSTDIDQSITQTSDESLINLKYGESWTDSYGRTYVIAYIDRMESGNIYRKRITDNDSRVTAYLKKSGSTDNLMARFAFIDAANVISSANKILLEQLEIINLPMARSVLLSYDPDNIALEKKKAAENIQIKVEVSGDEEGKISAVLSDWLVSRGFKADDNGNFFLSGVVNSYPVELNNDYENIGWDINVSLMDSNGFQIFYLTGKGRSSGVSKSAAEARTFSDIEKLLKKELNRKFNLYLDSFIN